MKQEGAWKKLGRIYSAGNIHPKLCSHASNPLPIYLEEDVYRVFFSGRDFEKRSSVGFVDIDICRREIVSVHNRPVFMYGCDESFFSHGVSLGNCYEAGREKYIPFMGWRCPRGEHWRGEIGRLILKEDFSLQIDSEKPLISLDEIDPVSLSYPWVLREKQGLYRMWYGSTVTWDAGNGEMLHVINYAISTDGHQWQRRGVSVPYQLGLVQAFSRPSVIGNREDGYEMWFSYRNGLGQKYRIGYAVSKTGEEWELKLDDAGIDVSQEGWDSEMIEYPFVFDHKGERYMLFNGNGYGQSGFGLALFEG